LQLLSFVSSCEPKGELSKSYARSGKLAVKDYRPRIILLFSCTIASLYSSLHFDIYPPLSFYYYLVCEAVGTATTPGLLCQPRVIVKMMWRSRWNVDWQGKPKFSEKTCTSATSVHHKIPHDQTRV
jgi:hypothetical protein